MIKKIFLTLLFLVIGSAAGAQKKDTVAINSNSLKIENLKPGKRTYLVYNKTPGDSVFNGIYLVKINVRSEVHGNKNVVKIDQSWEMNSKRVHTAETVLSRANLTTLHHNIRWNWNGTGYSSKYDFTQKQVVFEGSLPDSLKTRYRNDFNDSFKKFNLNWHSDLVIFPLLPFKEYRTFKINFYDPGSGPSQEVFYTVTGSEALQVSGGNKVDCWVLEHRLTDGSGGYQKFWVSKKGHEVIKEEDLFNKTYRYKIIFTVPGD